MTDKEVRKLRKAELLEVLIELSEENDRLKEEIEDLKQQLNDRNLKIDNCGSIAEASILISGILEAAQNAADCYLANIKQKCKEDNSNE